LECEINRRWEKGKWFIKGRRNKEIGEEKLKTVEKIKNVLLVRLKLVHKVSTSALCRKPADSALVVRQPTKPRIYTHFPEHLSKRRDVPLRYQTCGMATNALRTQQRRVYTIEECE